jgi:hypothetical protein
VVYNGKAALVSSLPPTNRLNLSIVLPLRNQAELTGLLGRLYDPSSADYRHFLSVRQFTDEFGPTVSDYQAVVRFAQANGLTVTSKPVNRLIVPVSGSVEQIEKAFNLTMNVYRHPTEDRTFFSPDREPSLNLSVAVAHIAGLNNFSIPRPMSMRAPNGKAIANITGSGPGGSYVASDMRAAYYGGTALTGAGQVVGLMEFGGYDLSDVNSTFSNANQTYSVPINNVLIDGATAGPVGGYDAEQVLDIVQAIGMAPGLSQVRVYIGVATDTAQDDANVFNAMATENIAKQISVSWGWNPDDPQTDDFIFQEFAAQGQTLFVASGDYGQYDPLFDFFYPGEDAYVTAVGGTHLDTNGAGGTWAAEYAWNNDGYASGGGISPDGISIPSWQAGVANASNGGSTTLRNVPDVAAEADFDNYNCNVGSCGGGWAGTSFAAPRWAGFMALINQQAVAAGNSTVGFIDPAIYAIGESSSYGNDFHDTVGGNNGTEGGCCGQQFFYAVPGYDLVTGWGSPNGQSLINALAPAASSGFQLSASVSSLVINPGGSAPTTVTVTDLAGFTGSVTLAVTSVLPSGVTASFGANPTNGSSVLTLTVSSAVLRGSYLVTVAGTSGAYSATTYVALQVNAPGFSIAPLNSTIEINPGLSGTNIVAVTGYAGFTGSVSLAVTGGLPYGVTASWVSNPTTGSSLLTLTAGDFATVGRSMVTVTGTSGDESEITTIALIINTADFFLNLSPVPFILVPGSPVSSTVTVVPNGNFSGPVTLATNVLPTGVTASFNPNPTTSTSVLTFTADNTATLQQASTINITGTASNNVANTSFQQTVAAAGSPTYALGILTSLLTLAQGASVTDTVTVTPQYGITGNVDLAISGLPTGVTASFRSNPTSGNTLLTLTASSSAAVGWGNFMEITSVSGNATPVYFFLNVNPAPAFSLTASKELMSVEQGASSQSTITVVSQTGFSGNVSLAVTSALPSGVTASFSSNPTTGSSVLTFTASGSAVPATSMVILSGTSGGVTATTNFALTVQPATTASTPTFSVAGGTYTSAQSVTISDAASGATIYYTTNGTTPTTSSTVYNNTPIAVSATETLEAMATAPGYTQSAVASATYTITQFVPTVVAGSSAFYLEAGQASYAAQGCAWTTASNDFTLSDSRLSITDTATAWITWKPTSGSCDTPLANSIVAYLSTDSTVGLRCYFASPRCTIATTDTAGSSGANVLPGVSDTSLPQAVLTAINGAAVNVAATDIRPEDAKFANLRVLAPCGTSIAGSQYLGLGYRNGNSILGSSMAGGGGFNVADFNLMGVDPITGNTLPGTYTVTPVGAVPIVVFVNPADESGFGSLLVSNVDRATLAGFLDGSYGRTADIYPASVGAGLAGIGSTVFIPEPLSGAYNAMEYAIPNSLELQTSQDLGLAAVAANSGAAGTIVPADYCSGTAWNNSMNPLVETPDSVSRRVNSSNPTPGRFRAIGTANEVDAVFTNQDSLGYAFWSAANFAGANAVNAKYLMVDGVDPLQQNWVDGLVPTAGNDLLGNVSLAHIKDGSYPIWSILRLVSDPSLSGPGSPVANLANAAMAQLSPTQPNFIAATQLQVVRSHFAPPAVTFPCFGSGVGTANNQPANGTGTIQECGGDVAGQVYSVGTDIDYNFDTASEFGNIGQRR